jgi:hypothetical protein
MLLEHCLAELAPQEASPNGCSPLAGFSSPGSTAPAIAEQSLADIDVAAGWLGNFRHKLQCWRSREQLCSPWLGWLAAGRIPEALRLGPRRGPMRLWRRTAQAPRSREGKALLFAGIHVAIRQYEIRRPRSDYLKSSRWSHPDRMMFVMLALRDQNPSAMSGLLSQPLPQAL